MSASMKYPWDRFKEEIRVFYIDEKNTLDKLLEYLQTLDPAFKPSTRMLKTRLALWGFHKNSCRTTSSTSRRSRKIAQNLPVTGNSNPDSTSTSSGQVTPPDSPTSITVQLPLVSLDHDQALNKMKSHLSWAASIPEWNQAHLDATYQDPLLRQIAMREAEAALKHLEKLKHQQSPRATFMMPQLELAAFEAGTTVLFFPSRRIWCQYLDFVARDAHEHEYSGTESNARLPTRLSRTQACALQFRSYLQTMYNYGNQLDEMDAEHWHLATFTTIKPFLRSFAAYLNAPKIARILRLTIEEQRYWKISTQHKVQACIQFWISFWWHDPDWFQHRHDSDNMQTRSTTSTDMRLVKGQGSILRVNFSGSSNPRLTSIYTHFQAMYGDDFDLEKCIPTQHDRRNVKCFMEMTSTLCIILSMIENWFVDAALYLR